MNSRTILCSTLLAGLLTATPGPAFTVTKNINTGKLPVEKVVLFAKEASHAHITFADNAWSRLSFEPDGAILSRIIGHKAIEPKILWKAGEGRPESFDVSAYTHLILTCRMEGSSKETVAGGKIRETRPDNLWFSAALFNAAGERVGIVSLADVNDDKTPALTTTLVIPLLLFTNSIVDCHHITAVGFMWGDARANVNRDFRLVIDRIALAD